MDAIVADLNRIIDSQFGLELRVLRWETDAYLAFHLEGPQGQVDEALQIDNCDIMVGIFWKRFSTPVRMPAQARSTSWGAPTLRVKPAGASATI